MQPTRNLSLLFLLTILGLLSCQSSKPSTTSNPSPQTDSKQATTKAKPLYKPFAEFNGDTLQYLNYNFVDHKEQYIGKTFSVLYHDLEFPVKSSLSGSDANNQLVTSSVSLYFVDAETRSYRMNNDNLPLYIIIAIFEKPVSSEAMFKLDMANNEKWTSNHEILLAEQVIKDVAVLKYIDPQSTKK